MKTSSTLGRFALLTLSAVLAWTVIFTPYNNSPPIRSDGTGYHIWVHAFKDRTWNFCNHEAVLEPVGAIAMRSVDNNVCGNKYPPGVGLIQFPFTSLLSSENIVDGFTEEANLTILILASALLIGTVYITGLTMHTLSVTPITIFLASFAGIFGTGLFHYATYDASFSHVYSAFFFACTLYIATKLDDAGRTSSALLGQILYATFCFLLILIRQTNILLIIGSSLILAMNKNIKNKSKSVYALLSASTTILGVAFYIAYNYYHLNKVTLSTYGGEQIVGIAEHSLKVFASYERGLFTYYPIFLVAVGIGIFARYKLLYFVMIGQIILFGLVYGSWHSWFLGGGFGHRGFVDMTPILIIVIGLGIEAIKKTNFSKIVLPLTITLITLAIYVTSTVQHAYWNSNYPFAGADQTLYWKTILPGEN